MSDKAPSEKSSEKGGKSQPPSVLGESIVEEDEQEDMKSQRSGGQMSQEEVEEPEDEFKKALVEVEKVNYIGILLWRVVSCQCGKNHTTSFLYKIFAKVLVKVYFVEILVLLLRMLRH